MFPGQEGHQPPIPAREGLVADLCPCRLVHPGSRTGSRP